MSKPRYHVKTTSGYAIGRDSLEVDPYVMDRAYNNEVVATFRRKPYRQTLNAARLYVVAQAQPVADVLNKLDELDA